MGLGAQRVPAWLTPAQGDRGSIRPQWPRTESMPSSTPQHVKNSKHTNKYEGWPEALEMEGCIPRRPAAS